MRRDNPRVCDVGATSDSSLQRRSGRPQAQRRSPGVLHCPVSGALEKQLFIFKLRLSDAERDGVAPRPTARSSGNVNFSMSVGVMNIPNTLSRDQQPSMRHRATLESAV